MRLQNKKTGEMCELKVGVNGDLAITKDDEIINICSSLAELNEDWEDYEEPKECDYWYIEVDGEIFQCHKPTFINHLLDKQKAIGNYFETKEKAEKAVEKLKAWKRLKDKGVKLEIVTIGHRKYLEPTAEDDKTFDEAKELIKDFELIFGGEE